MAGRGTAFGRTLRQRRGISLESIENGPARCLGGVGPIGRNVVHPDLESKRRFASRNLTLDAQSQQESHVKWTSLCIEPNAKSLKLFNPQSQAKMPSDTLRLR